MAEGNSAQEPTNFPVGNDDEVPSQSPEKVETPKATDGEVVPNDHPEQDIKDAKDAREEGAGVSGAPVAGGAGGGSLESPETDPNRADAEPAAKQASAKLNK